MTPRRDDVSDGRDAPDGVASPSLDGSARVSVATSTARGSGARASCPARRVMRCRAKGASPDATRGREKLGGFSSFVMSLSFVSFAVRFAIRLEKRNRRRRFSAARLSRRARESSAVVSSSHASRSRNPPVIASSHSAIHARAPASSSKAASAAFAARDAGEAVLYERTSGWS